MFDRILVPLDGSAAAEQGLRQAIELARAFRTAPHLILLHVIEPPVMVAEAGIGYGMAELTQALSEQGEGLLERARARCEAAGLGAETELRDAADRVAEVVVQRARERRCDLVVMGTHGRRGPTRWVMGSDAEIVARHSPVPVMLVRELRPGE